MSSLWICLWWRHPGHTCRKHTDPPRILYQSWARDNFGATTRQCDVVFYCSFCDKLKSEESLLLGIKMKFWRFTRVLWKATFFGCHTTVPNCRNSCSVCPAIFSTVHAKKKYQIWLLIPYQVINIILQTTGVVGKLSMKNFKYWHLVFYSVLQWFITLICCRIITIFIWIFPQHRNLYSFSLYQA